MAVSKIKIISLRLRALTGNAAAQCSLGYKHLYGQGVKVNVAKAHDLFSRAAAAGNSRAISILSEVFADGGKSPSILPEKESFVEAARTIHRDADAGKPEALWLRGRMRLNQPDKTFVREAISDLTEAAGQGYVPAMCSLGQVYYNENLVAGRKAEGMWLVERAAELEWVPAISTLVLWNPGKAFDILKSVTEKPDAPAEAFGMMSQFFSDGVVVDRDYNEALRLLKIASDKGNPDAASNLGYVFEEGIWEQPRNVPLAVSYYQRSIDLGSKTSMVNLGCILERSDVVPQDHKRAFELYSMAAQAGIGQAYNNLANCYKRGIGTEADANKALQCYKKAIGMGCHDEAYVNLYRFFTDGVCVPVDYDAAISCLHSGDAAGNAQCSYVLGRIYLDGVVVDEDDELAVACLTRAVNSGIAEAGTLLGHCYRYGRGVEADGAKAFHYYQEAAACDVEALANLGQCYTYAIGVNKDDAMAVEIYRRAAEQGDANAQFDLAICYRQGEGVEQNFDAAVKWYNKAIEQGNANAMNNLAILYDCGLGVDKNPAKAAELFLMGAEHGNADAMFGIGLKYFNGEGVPQDYAEAVKWFKQASAQGEPDSMTQLAICYGNGYGVPVDYVTANRYLFTAADLGWPRALAIIEQNHVKRLADSADSQASC